MIQIELRIAGHFQQHPLLALPQDFHCLVGRRVSSRSVQYAKSIQPEELLREEDIARMIQVARHPRDKAFVHVLYESGCRIGEVLGLRIRNVQFDDYGGQIIVAGKTGMRRIRLVSSVPALATWLDNHQLRDDPNALVWICLATNRMLEPLHYRGASTLLKKLAVRAQVRKRIHPHLFRHSRLTELARKGRGESILKEFAGWTQRSDQAATYVHLSGRDTDSAILKINGITTKVDEDDSKLKPTKCPRCRVVNSPTAKFCNGCGAVLDAVASLDIQDKMKKAQWVEGRIDVRSLAEDLEKIREQLNWLASKSQLRVPTRWAWRDSRWPDK